MSKPDPGASEAAEPEQTEPEQTEPLNRAERRAARRGKKAAPAQGHGPVAQPGRSQAMLPPRRAGRRGNR